MFYVGVQTEEVGVRIEGDADTANRFMTLFELPEKIG